MCRLCTFILYTVTSLALDSKPVASLWRGRVDRDGYKDQIVTRLHSVMWVCLCFPRHIHSSWSTLMARLCIPVPRLVSCTFSTIPICPFLIQRIFALTCLHSFFTCIQQITCTHVHARFRLYQQLYQQLYLPVL